MLEDEYSLDAVRALKARIQIEKPERDEFLSCNAGSEPVYDLTFRCSQRWPLEELKEFCVSLNRPGCLERIDDEKGEIWVLFVPYVTGSLITQINDRARSINDNVERAEFKASLRSTHYAILTSQEMDILVRSACEGKSGTGWRDISQRGTRTFETKGGTHRVDVPLRDEETGEDMTWEAVAKLTGAQDSDFAIMAFYVFGVLVPPDVLPENRLAGAWIDLNDVLGKIGWLASKPSEAEKEELRKRLYEFLRFGSRAVVTGKRSVSYRDPVSGEDIPTRIESAPWRIMGVQRPEPESLTEENLRAPTRVYLAISKEWEILLTDRNLAQYLPLGELLGSIPPYKIAGDWARCMGIYLARSWRVDLHGAVAGTVDPTRRALLTDYTPKTRTVEDLLSRKNPERAVRYYREALQILLEKGLIDSVGDAARTVTPETLIREYPGYGWGEKWLDGASGIRPGVHWQPVLQELSAKKHIPKPRNLRVSKSTRNSRDTE